MLLGKDFSGRHQRHLIARLECLQSCQRRHNGLARTHIALDQTQHGLRLTEVIGHFVTDSYLRACRRETQIGQKLCRQLLGFGQGRRPQ